MANTRRIPFVLNLDDPVDAAIWEALEPMLDRRRASQFIRGAVAHALGAGGLLPPVTAPPPTLESPPQALLADGVPKAKRPTPRAVVDMEAAHPHDQDDGSTLEEATSNFLTMFG